MAVYPPLSQRERERERERERDLPFIVRTLVLMMTVVLMSIHTG